MNYGVVVLKFSLITAILLLAGCAAPDGPEPGTYASPTPGDYILIVIPDDKIQALYKRRGGRKKKVSGFALIKAKPCRIYLAVSAVRYRLEHERRHCSDGWFHR